MKGYFGLWSSDEDGGLHSLLVGDMPQTESYQIKEGDGDYYCIVWSEEMSMDMELEKGWSIISLPIKPNNAPSS